MNPSVSESMSPTMHDSVDCARWGEHMDDHTLSKRFVTWLPGDANRKYSRCCVTVRAESEALSEA